MSDNVCVMKGEGREGGMEKKGGWGTGGVESHTDRLNGGAGGKEVVTSVYVSAVFIR